MNAPAQPKDGNHAARVMALSRQQITQFFSAFRIVPGRGASVSNTGQPFITRRP